MNLKTFFYFFASITAYSLQAMEQSNHPLIQVTPVFDIQRLILEYASGWEIKLPIEVSENIYSIVYSSDNRYLIKGNLTGELCVYDAQTNQLLKTFTPGERDFKALLPLPDGNCLVGSDLGTNGIATLGLLNLQNKDAITYTKIETKLDKILALAYSSTGEIAITYHDGFTLASIENGKLIQSKLLKKHKDHPYALAFSPNGKYVATGSRDKLIKITETTNLNTVSTLQGHASALKNIIWISNTQLISIAEDDLQVRIWDVSNLEKPTCEIIKIEHKPAQLVSLSPQKNYVIYRRYQSLKEGSIGLSNKQISLCIFDLQSKHEITILPDTKLSSYEVVLAISPNGQYMAAGMRLWANPILIAENATLPLLINHKQTQKKS